MKKAIGLIVLTVSLMAGAMTAYAAPAVTGPGCGQGTYECMRDGVCTYSDCPYHGTGIYDGNGCQIDHTHDSNCGGTVVYDGNGCQIDHTHNSNCSGTVVYDGNGCQINHTHNSNCSGTTSGSGHHSGRGHHGRGHC